MLREQGSPFNIGVRTTANELLEADGRTAGGRAVLWITDTTIKGLEESGARARFEEARTAIARDPMAFLEMLGKAPFPAWRMSGAGKLQWVNKAYMKAVGAEITTRDQAEARARDRRHHAVGTDGDDAITRGETSTRSART